MAPAVVGNLFIVGTTLVYNGNPANNNVTVSGTDSAFVISESAGTIHSTVPGFTSGSSITGAIPSSIQSIAINGQNGTDVVTIGVLTTTRNLIAAGTTVNFTGALSAQNVTASGTLVNLGANVSTNAGSIAGSFTESGTLDVSATATINTRSTLDGNINLNGLVVGSAAQTLNAAPGGNVTAANAINLGGASGLTITGNNVNLHQVVDGGVTSITAQKAVNLNGALISTSTIAILANQGGVGPYGFTQVAGDINAGGSVAITVNTATGGTGSANVRGITGPFLLGSATTLTATTNTGGIDVTDANALTVASATANGGNVRLVTTGATNDLTITGNVSTAAGGTVTLTSGQDLKINSGNVSSDTATVTLTPGRNLTVASGVDVTTGGAIVVTAPLVNTNEDISGTLLATGDITINSGAAGNVNTFLSISGTVAAGALATARLKINAAGGLGGTGMTNMLLSGTIATPVAGSNAIAVNGSGTTLFMITGALSTPSGQTTVTGSTGGTNTFMVTPSTGSVLNLVGNGGGDSLLFPGTFTFTTSGTNPNKTYTFTSSTCYQNVNTTNIP